MLHPPVEMLQEIKHPFFVVLVAKKSFFFPLLSGFLHRQFFVRLLFRCNSI